MRKLKEKIHNFLFSGPKVSKLEQESKESKVSFYSGITYLTLHRIFRYVVVGLVFLVFILVGFGGGYALGIVRQQSIPTVKQLSQQINHSASSATLYYADNQKIATVTPDTKVTKATSSELTPLIKKAVTATEDETFYKHHGVLPKSIVRAVMSEVSGIGVQTGGSTLTQQLVKMQFLTSQTTWRRKITEMLYARKLEKHFTKTQILTAYLNAAPYGKNNSGQNITGIKTASEGIFGKSIKDLTLPEAAFLAGLPQSPSVYTPYNSNGEVKKDLSLAMRRKDIVLFRMYRNGDITKSQYLKAKKYDLRKDFLKPTVAPEIKKQNSYLYNLAFNKGMEILTDYLIKQDNLKVADVKKDTNRYSQYQNNAYQLLHQKGYQIHTTIRKSLYTAMNKVVKESNLGEDHTSRDYNSSTNKWTTTTEHVQNGSVVIDNSTGKVLAFSGGVDFSNSQTNHAFDTYRSPGSSIKPYLVYAPAVENQIISTQTALADFPTHFGKYIPTDYNSTTQNKFIPAQEALAKSYNIPAVNLYNRLRSSRINLKSTMKKLGLNLTNNEYKSLGIALGGTDYGFSVADNASAFSNFYNDGQRADPYYIDKITDPSGKVIYQHKEKTQRVYSSGTAYIMQKMLRQVVKSGTASGLNGLLDFDDSTLIGKTGTSNDYRDIWFNGSTPGITISSWIGYDNYYGHTYNLDSNSSTTNLTLWANIANALYKIDPSIFKLDAVSAQPSTVKRSTVLKETGTLPGTVSWDGQDITLDGDTTTALSLKSASPASAEFGIGASNKDYTLFYDYYQGKSNKYGQELLYTGKTISKNTKNISSYFVSAGSSKSSSSNSNNNSSRRSSSSTSTNNSNSQTQNNSQTTQNNYNTGTQR